MTGQTTTGVRALLSQPAVYEIWSRMVGGEHGRRTLIRDHASPTAGMRVLDLGCGPGELLAHLPLDLEYVGVDLSPEYVRRARGRFGHRAEFRVGDATAIDADLKGFDLVIAFGVLHHLTDDQVRRLTRGAAGALVPGGRFVAVDPTVVAAQSRAARAVISRDRGQHVRSPASYERLARTTFSRVATVVRDDLLRIPYTHCIVECSGLPA